MLRSEKKFPFLSSMSLLSALLLALTLWGCGGGSGADGGGTAQGGGGSGADYSNVQVELYKEVPVIEITGGDTGLGNALFFNPKSQRNAELYPSVPESATPDTPINDFLSMVNATNRMFDAEMAACIGLNDSPDVIISYLQPDTMPSGTFAGTQYIQLVMPFDVDPTSIFDANPFNVGTDYLTGSIVIINDKNQHVNSTVLLDGKDAFGVGGYFDPDNLPGDIQIAPNVIIFIARPQVDITGGSLPAVPTAFNSNPVDPANWDADVNEIRIRISTLRDRFGNDVDVNSSHYVAKAGFDKDAVRPDLSPSDIISWNVVGTDPNEAAPDNQIVSRTPQFILRFNKPVIPETVGRSLVFDPPPFNGNTKVIENPLLVILPMPTQCDGSGGNPEPRPLATNVSIIVYYVDSTGAAGASAEIPFRIYPLHQNNMATYVIDPLIPLPGTTPAELQTDNPVKVRVEVNIYPQGQNANTGDPDDAGPLTPVNLGPCSFFAEQYTGGGSVIRRVFTVAEGGRYVNAPVCPNAIYYTMGTSGVGVIDTDGNGITTNHPDTSKEILVTSLRFYQKQGNNSLNQGNNYAYGSKASPTGFVGLGELTPVPGINEGSDGIDTVTKDSQGRSQLYPDPEGDVKFANITDVAVGDFLDAMFFDIGNVWAKDVYHTSYVLGGELTNNTIDTPPTPNPPPLTIPIGMRATDILVDGTGLVEDGVFVIMGKEVFALGVHQFWPQPWPYDTSFVHLNPANHVVPYTGSDEPFPPNPTILFGTMLDFVNAGPLAESSTMGTGFGGYGARQQIGNFLFAADKGNNVVRVLNSNSMESITTITGFNQPDSVAVSSDLENLYVSNWGSGYLSVFNVDPKSSLFLSHMADVKVGEQPKGIGVQPAKEDVFVCNYGSDDISIVNGDTNTLRKTISSLVSRPWDIVLAPRQSGFGWGTQVYHGYISNFGGGNVLIYESGPDGYGGIGYDDILSPVPDTGAGGQVYMPIEGPRGICFDPHFVDPFYLNGGCFVAHRSGNYPMVSRINFTKQQGTYGPVYLVPIQGMPGGTPGFGQRTFEITAQWGGPGNPLSGTSGSASDVALLDYNRDFWLNNNWTGNPYVTNYGGVSANPFSFLPKNNKFPIRFLNIWGWPNYYPTVNPDRLYISYEFNPVIDVIDITTGAVLTPISGLDRPAKNMKSYFKM